MRFALRRGVAILTLMVAFGMAHTPMPAALAQTVVQASAPRSEMPLSQGWRFRFGGDAKDVTALQFDDADWAQITVPHSWNNVGGYSLIRSPERNARQGIGWYRLAFSMPKGDASQRHFLQFDGVGAIAEIWVNGVLVGEHKGAFARFRFDVTPQLKPDATNVIVVKADNSKAAAGSSTENILPLGGDFFIHGGLYRSVLLISTDSAQIDLLDQGGPGVYISTPSVTADSADIDVRTLLRNLGGKSRKLSVMTTIRDAQGVTVASDRTPTRLDKWDKNTVRRTLTIARPHLWQGRESPYLYQATVELLDGSRIVDRVVQAFGVRTFSFDPNKGFILNGKPVPLHGASRHQDRAGKGWALAPQDHAEDLAIMAEMGVNTVRHAHYQHAQEWVAEADKAGMVVWAELPFVHESSLTDGDPTPELVDNAKTQLVELIRQNFNHPSIMMWSVGNEIDIRPALEALRPGSKAMPARSLALLKALDVLAQKEDPSRPTAYADCCEGTVLELKDSQILSGVTGVSAYNRYYGWYYGQPEDLGPALDALHAKYPATPIGIAEFGAGGAFSQHTDHPEGGPINAFGRPHPEEYQSWVHEKTWPQLAARPYLAGSWIWNMFDFASTTRDEGEATDLNDKGLVSYDRKKRKDAFYFYKAHWSTEPVLNITGRRYVDRAYPAVDVRVYSNAQSASLTVNGASIGEAPCPGHICVWPNIPLKAGGNLVTVQASINGQSMTDMVQWTSPGPEKGFYVDSGTLTGSVASNGQRFGSDNFFKGGAGKDLNAPGVGLRPAAQPKPIAATPDSGIYGSYREGQFRYDFPLPNGSWTISLLMMEPDSKKADSRTFAVSANGVAVLKDFNPSVAAGGVQKAVTCQFPVRVRDGKLQLEFIPQGGAAVVSAIMVSKTNSKGEMLQSK